MSQTMLIGISGLDADLLRVYGPSLPNLRRLMLESPFLELESTVPPEPLPAWSSAYSGLNPANHGILAKMDCLERDIPDPRLFQEVFFWERAARAGKRVCVLNPPLSTTRTVEGLVLVPSTPPPTDGSAPPKEVFPTLLDEPLIPPASQLTAFCDTLRERTEQQVRAALALFARESWDLFVAQFDALDHIQHFFWRYSDPGDPLYPGKNEHANRILEFYRFFDGIVGRFRAAINNECVLGVVSSHGHERRCTYRLHINEWLRTQDFLTPLNPLKPLFKRSTSRQTRGLVQLYLEDLSTWLAQHLPWKANQAGSRHGIDQNKTVAQLVELTCSTSSYGGISINRALLEREGRSYELVCEAIVTGLEQLCVKESPVVNWARRREQCYQGKYLDRYPDILFELRSDFGVGRKLYTPLVSPDSTHRLISGTHSLHGVFLLTNWPGDLETYQDFQPPSVMDVAPTLLSLLGVKYQALDGQALVHPHPIRQLI
jgi:predicted AlkP superfamily phosphohydrolase/phosphomutase